MLDAPWRDLKYGWRMLWRDPGFAAVAILTLAIGIGANTAIFSVIDAVLLRPLPITQPDRVVLLWETDANRGIERGTASLAEFLDWRDQKHVFRELSAYRTLFFTMTGRGEPEQVYGGQASVNFFHLLGVAPILGRDFLPVEEQPGNEQVVLLSYGLWQRHYGGDRGILGKSIALDGRSFTVVGVMPRGFSLFGTNRDDELWVPFAFRRAELDRLDHEVIVFGRLKDGISVQTAQAEMEIIAARLRKEYPAIDQKNGLRIVRFKDDLVRGLGPALLILMVAVGLVLLIACANVANLMLARASAREREMAVRAALGARSRRLLQQLLTESLLLAAIGGAFGVLFAYGGLQLLRVQLSTEGVYRSIRHPDWIGINSTVLLFTLGISLITGIFCGLFPALHVSRSALHQSLKEGSRGSTTGRKSHFVRSALVVAEVSLSVMLLAGAGLLIRSLSRLLSQDLGFNSSHLLTMQIWLPEWRYSTAAQVSNFFQQLIPQVRREPGVRSASAVNYLPLTGWADYCNFDVAGRARPAPGEEFTSQFRVVDQGYLATMGIFMKEGRDFRSSDGANTEGVVIINESLARRYWPNEDAVGKKIRLLFPPTRTPWSPDPNPSWLRIVGVAGDIRDWAWSDPHEGYLYLPYVQNPSRLMRLVVRTNGKPAALTSTIRRAVADMDSNQPVTDVQTMDDVLDKAISERRLSMLLLVVFASAATLLAGLGIYGVMAYGVTQRTHEIGIRMALGAERKDVMEMVLRDGVKLIAAGLGIGALGCFASMRFLQSQLYGVGASDPLTLAAAAVSLTSVALAACYFPARRATKVDPLVALRYE